MLRLFFVLLFLGSAAPLVAAIVSPALGSTICNTIWPVCDYPVWLGSIAALSLLMSFVTAGF